MKSKKNQPVRNAAKNIIRKIKDKLGTAKMKSVVEYPVNPFEGMDKLYVNPRYERKFPRR